MPSAPIRLITLDPGHFHAALVQKTMTAYVSPVVHVYAPEGADLAQHLDRIERFNSRPDAPTRWRTEVHASPDFLERMLDERPGNVVVIAGNNRAKPDRIARSVAAGLHVLADKPMAIDAAGRERLEEAFRTAGANGVLLYDIMTERYEIATILQRALVHRESLFGELLPGTPDDPSITKESVHHFAKTVAGLPLRRPAWSFDTAQQGEGIVDVTTHLVDLVFWAAFPDEAIDYERDVRLHAARRWPTPVTRAGFARVTGEPDFPDSLRDRLDANGVLPLYANGEIAFGVRGVHARVSVIWDFEAPPGGGDTHFSVMKGSRARVEIRQGPEEGYRPALYVEPAEGVQAGSLEAPLREAVTGLSDAYPGLAYRPARGGWEVVVPDAYHVGHEAHFGQVAEKFFDYVLEGSLPPWEVPNMRARYALTTNALEMARR